MLKYNEDFIRAILNFFIYSLCLFVTIPVFDLSLNMHICYFNQDNLEKSLPLRVDSDFVEGLLEMFLYLLR